MAARLGPAPKPSRRANPALAGPRAPATRARTACSRPPAAVAEMPPYRAGPPVPGLQYRPSSTGPPVPTGCAPAWSASQPPRQTAPCSSRLSPRSHPPQSPALPWQRTVRENARCVQRFKRGQSTKVRAHYLERRLAVPHRVFRLLELGERAGAGKAGRGGQSGQKQSFDAVAPTGGVTMRWTHGNQALLGLRAGRLIILAPDRACYRCPKSNARSSL